MEGSYCVGIIYYAENGSGNAFMHKYGYNKHHIEVNLESRDDIYCYSDGNLLNFRFEFGT